VGKGTAGTILTFSILTVICAHLGFVVGLGRNIEDLLKYLRWQTLHLDK